MPQSINLSAKLVEGKQIPRLSHHFFNLKGLRTVTYLENLSKCSQLKKLMHPLISGPSIDDLDDSHEVISLLERDELVDLAF